MGRPDQPPLPQKVIGDLPVDVQEELANQEIGTLEHCRQWIDELIAHKRQLLTEEELSTVAIAETTGEKVLTTLPVEDRSDVETKALLGRFVWHFITCDSDRCDCTSGRPGDLHGPYLRRQYIDGSGHRTTEYIPKSDRRQKLVQRLVPQPSPADIEESVRE